MQMEAATIGAALTRVKIGIRGELYDCAVRLLWVSGYDIDLFFRQGC